MPLTSAEEAVCHEIERRRDDLVELLRALIRFDTTTHQPGEPAREEQALQGYLAERLERAGADVRVWEPDVAPLAGHPMIPEGFSFAGRPQLAARFAGSGGGRTLIFNGHIDVVSVEPVARWAHDPFEAVVADGRVHGRGSCDMKGGVASMAFAAEVLAGLGVRLAGDLIVNTVSEEESTGAGGLAMAHALAADAAIVPEPGDLDVWIACRGSLLPTILVEGRSGHAGIAPRHPDDGGPVNAIEKMAILLEAVQRLGRGVDAAPAAPLPVAGRDRPDRDLRWRVDRQLPGVVPPRLPHRVPAGVGRRGRLRQPCGARVRGLDRTRGGDRPVAARAPAAHRVADRRRAAGRGRGRTSRSCRSRSRRRARSAARASSAGSTTGTTAPR